jgi:hypothetical protein
MSMGRFLVALLLMVAIATGAMLPAAPASGSGKTGAKPAPPEVIAELGLSVERARQRFEARDASGVLASVSEQYRSDGITKPVIRQQLLAMFALYDEMRARVAIDQVRLVDGGAWLYTSGEVSGHLPLVGWVPILTWQNQPEVARREGSAWRLFGFQN